MVIFAFCVIMFEPIKIQTRLTPQNDCLNISFLRYENIVGKTMAKNGPKWPFILSDSFPIRVQCKYLVVAYTPVIFLVIHNIVQKIRGATTGKASKAWALPRFWVSICSYKKQPVKKIWGRILGLAWLRFALVPLVKTSMSECSF